MSLKGRDEGARISSSTQSYVSGRRIISPHQAECANRKKLQFSLLNAQDTVKIAEFEVTHRDLYTAAERLPVKDGVLDRRLVSP